MKSFVMLQIMPAMASVGSLFRTLTGGHTVGGFLLGLLALCGVFVAIRYLFWLIFTNNKKKIFESCDVIHSHLKNLINGYWSKRPRTTFVIGEFEGQYRQREVAFKIVESKFPVEPAEMYLLLKPNTPQTQNLPTPSMSFHFALKRYPKPTENTYIKGGWLIHKPKFSYGQLAGDFYSGKQNLIQALDELTQAAEIIEAKPLVEASKPKVCIPERVKEWFRRILNRGQRRPRMKDFAILPIMPVMASTSSLFSTLTGGHTVGGFLLGLLVLCGLIYVVGILVFYLEWLFSSGVIESKFYSHLKYLINGQWSKSPKQTFVKGELKGLYKGREVICKVVLAVVTLEPQWTYLLLKPNTFSDQNVISPAMIFGIVFKRYPKPTENTYIKAGWLIHKPKLSYKVPSPREFYFDKQNIIQALDELIRAAEIIEAKPLVEASKPKVCIPERVKEWFRRILNRGQGEE